MKEERILEEVEKVFASMQLSPQKLTEVIAYIKTSANAEKDYHKRRVGELRSEETKIKSRMEKLTDLFLDGDIDKTTHEEKRRQLIEKREVVSREIEAHHKADDEFINMLISLVELASNALKTFKSSKIEEKRKLIKLVFSNLELNVVVDI